MDYTALLQRVFGELLPITVEEQARVTIFRGPKTPGGKRGYIGTLCIYHTGKIVPGGKLSKEIQDELDRSAWEIAGKEASRSISSGKRSRSRSHRRRSRGRKGADRDEEADLVDIVF